MHTIPEAFAAALQQHRAGQLQVAEQTYRQILEVEPSHSGSLHMLGLIAHQRGQHPVAIEYMRRALRQNPHAAACHNNLGEAYRALQRFDEAAACYRRAIKLEPRFPEAHNGLGVVLCKNGKLGEAIRHHRRALNLRPDYADARVCLGDALMTQGKMADATACYRRALKIRPDHAKTYSDLGASLQSQGKLEEAIACYRRALEIEPGLAEATNNLGTALQAQGRVEEAIEAFRLSFQIRPASPSELSNAICCEQYRPGVTLPGLAEIHAEWEERYGTALRTAWRPHVNSRDPERPLRLGFVSGDFGRHPVGFFIVRTWEALRVEPCQIVAYSCRSQHDDLTARLQAATDTWRDVPGLTSEALAEQIRNDQIDIIFDLAGHTSRNQLLVFARKPAPLQITYAGYVGTTGLGAMDYLLADDYEVPAESERWYRERVLRMPGAYVCYDPPEYAPPVSPLPALAESRVTFGSFNNAAKLNAGVIQVWSEILRRLPRSRLVLKYRGMDDPSVAGWLTEMFASQQIAPDRVEFLGPSPHAELLDHYRRIDVALDPFPYNGGLTTCEALWMGVPVITCPGETFAGRHSLSHLSNVGLTETIAGDLDHYAEVAVSLAQDQTRLAALRTNLRARVASSTLCDGKRFATDLMTLLRGVWREWVAVAQK